MFTVDVKPQHNNNKNPVGKGTNNTYQFKEGNSGLVGYSTLYDVVVLALDLRHLLRDIPTLCNLVSYKRWPYQFLALGKCRYILRSECVSKPSVYISKQFLIFVFAIGVKVGSKKKPQKLTKLSPRSQRSQPRHLVEKRIALKDTTSDSQVNINFPNRWSPASLTFNIYFYLFLYIYIRFREYTSNRHNISVAMDPHGMLK